MPVDINSIQTWAIVISTIVTSLTGFFLVQTFLLQARSSMEQSKLIELQMENMHMDKKPLFVANRKMILDGNGDNSEFAIELELKRNDIYSYHCRIDVNSDIVLENFKFYRFISQIQRGLIEGTKIPIKYSYENKAINKFLDENGSINDLRFSIWFWYSDIVGNYYVQEIGVVFDREPFIYPPTMPGRTHKIDKRFGGKNDDALKNLYFFKIKDVHYH